MRLIDADKLLPKLWVCYEENKPIVDAEPTVEAIPIEWVENHIKQLSDIADGFDKDSLSYFLSNVKLDALKDMLKAWEKESDKGNIDS